MNAGLGVFQVLELRIPTRPGPLTNPLYGETDSRRPDFPLAFRVEQEAVVIFKGAVEGG